MDTEEKGNAGGGLWQQIKAANRVMLVLFIGIGILLWGGFNAAVEATNQEAFCISCHVMEENVYMEYQDTIHNTNRTGVRATCPDCHVPKDWGPKMVRKIKASNDLLELILGTIDTREKFQARRLELAKRVWETMKESDSRECRNCHEYDAMDLVEQEQRAFKQHSVGFDNGKTCIDCHKGIAHKMPTREEPV